MIKLKRNINKKLRTEVEEDYKKRLSNFTNKEYDKILSTTTKHLECINNSNQQWINELYIHIKIMFAMVLIDKSRFEDMDSDMKKICIALDYFIDHDDIIPDHVIGDGFLDDAIFTNLVISKLSKRRRELMDKMITFVKRDSS